MPEKHINRKKRDLSAEDEWAHITGVGEKIDTADAMDVQDRSITFRNEFGEPLTNYEVYNEEKTRVQDHFGNTAQYLKFVNESLKEKKNRLNELYEKQRKFQEDLDALQFNQPKSKEKLDQIRYKDIKSNDVEQTLKYLEQDRESIRKKMDHYASMVSHSQIELLEKDKQIAEIKAELEIIKKREENQKTREAVDPVSLIQNKLKELGIENDPEKIKTIVDSLAAKIKEEQPKQS